MRIDGRDVVTESFRLYGRHAAVVVGASALIQTVGLVLTFLCLNSTNHVVSIAGTLAVYGLTTQLTTGVFTLLLQHLRQGRPVPSISDLIVEALPLLPGLIAVGVLTSVGIGLGFLCFVVPGFILNIRWALAAPARVVGGHDTIDAIKASAALTKEHVGTTFAVMVFQGGIVVVLPELVSAVTGDGATENWLLAEAVFMALLAPLPAIALADLYFRLAGGAPSPDPSLLPIPTPADLAGPHAAHAQPSQFTPQPQPFTPQPQPHMPPPYAPAPTPAPAPPARTHSVAPPGMG